MDQSVAISSNNFLFRAPVVIFSGKTIILEKLYTTYLYERVELLSFRAIHQLEKDVFQLFNNYFEWQRRFVSLV